MFFLLFLWCFPFAFLMVVAVFWTVLSHIIVPLVGVVVLALVIWLIVHLVKR